VKVVAKGKFAQEHYSPQTMKVPALLRLALILVVSVASRVEWGSRFIEAPRWEPART